MKPYGRKNPVKADSIGHRDVWTRSYIKQQIKKEIEMQLDRTDWESYYDNYWVHLSSCCACEGLCDEYEKYVTNLT